ncbi:winged helix-turn-helix transcriptional regulator [Paracoccus sp. 11-3]|uniref:Winged helix-turn-helix transcriptional regulator n=1 Tax=Paracoccus amoyensis TaxID=2760093 RepID=A0A926GIP5_9RHOB|nr:winged helix-turn-helix domain-containing protein [Paracoccus amoyensis]MBC9247964.1 winged helix-turn-helix transcriptional regulator [Paracoccus amoyensis]
MKYGPDISRIASLIGDPARANMLTALMSGKALTATELAAEAGVTPQTASSHLARLEQGGLLSFRKQGRHKYAALASEQVAQVLEMLMGIAARAGHTRTRTGPRNQALREARICYNHLAGDCGTRMFDRLIERDLLIQDGDDLRLTDIGKTFMRGFGIDLPKLVKGKTPMCRTCLDWSERRSHLAGSLGRALLSRIEDLGWARRDRDTRIVTFTPQGRQAFDALFG